VRTRRTVALVALAVAVAPSGCSRSSGSTEAFCREVRQVPALESVLNRFSEADPDLLADRIAKARAAYERLADAAPGEIRDETAQVVELVDAVLQAVEDHPSDPAAAADQLREAVADQPEAERSRAEVAAFAQERCDVRLDPTLAPSSGSSTTVAPATTTTTAAGATTTTAG
jgi:hypothetical protein